MKYSGWASARTMTIELAGVGASPQHSFCAARAAGRYASDVTKMVTLTMFANVPPTDSMAVRRLS